MVDFLLKQVYTFTIMFFYGIILGLVFNLYQIAIHRVKPGKIITGITDTIFSLLTGITGFAFLVYANWGELRFFTIFSIVVGFFIYFCLKKIVTTK